MITKIELDNFKCFKHISIPQNHLNVYSGLNSMGKSSTIQSMLLLKQSMQNNLWPHNVILNGDYINIGTGRDLLYEDADEDCIGIAFFDDKKKHSINIQYQEKLDTLSVTEYDPEIERLFDCRFEYLNAERSSPQVIYPKSSLIVDSFSQLGIHGEYTAHFLSKFQEAELPWDSCNGEAQTIRQAVQYWLNEISPNVKLEAFDIDNTDLTRLGFYYNKEGRSKIYRPTNVGFGISYVLPIIVALIKSTKDSLVIIENPEAHLHPKGQRKMGELIARASAAGAVIHVETHSDHVLNGIRIAVKNKIINHTYVNLLFFCIKDIDGVSYHTIETPLINENGKLNAWPDGFFDEWDKALDEII